VRKKASFPALLYRELRSWKKRTGEQLAASRYEKFRSIGAVTVE